MEIQKSKIQKPQVVLLQEKAGVYVVKLTIALEQAGYEVNLLTRETYPWLYHLRCFLHLLWAGKSYSVAHAHSSGTAMAMKAAWWFTGVPSILTVHNNHIFEEKWTFQKAFDRVMCMETRYQQEISITERFLKAVNVNEQVLVIPPGVDVSVYEALDREKTEDFHVLYVGDLTREKGVDLLLNAAGPLDIQVDIVGDGPEMNRLKSLAKSLSAAKVRFHGIKRGEARLQFYKRADLFVMPSRVDGLPYELLEAAASRLPILASEVGDHRKVVLDGVNGHLVQAGDQEEWNHYLEQYVLNPHLKQMGDASFDLVNQEYTWERAIERHLRVYETLRESKTRSRLALWNLPKMGLNRWRGKELKASRRPLRFHLTLDLEPSPSHDSEYLRDFLKQYEAFCVALEIRSTVFVEWDLLEGFLEEVKALRKAGHELGVKVRPVDFSTGASRKATLRQLRNSLKELGLRQVKQLRAEEDLGEAELEMVREAGFEWVAVSQDPLPRLVPLKMDWRNWLDLEEQDLLQAVLRLRAEQEESGEKPRLVFQMRSWECENFTELSKRLALLKEHMKLEFLTLSDS